MMKKKKQTVNVKEPIHLTAAEKDLVLSGRYNYRQTTTYKQAANAFKAEYTRLMQEEGWILVEGTKCWFDDKEFCIRMQFVRDLSFQTTAERLWKKLQEMSYTFFGSSH